MHYEATNVLPTLLLKMIENEKNLINCDTELRMEGEHTPEP